MLGGAPTSLGERLAAANDQNQLKGAIIGTLMMRMGVTEIELDMTAWFDAPDCRLAVGYAKFSPKVSLEIGSMEREKSPPGWVDEMRLDFDGLGR